MLYKSPYADLQVLVRSESVQYHPATGVEINRIRELTANFGSHGGTFTATDPISGNVEEYPIIHGHYFDSKEASERLGWNDDELESVDATLNRLCREQPYLIAAVDMSIPAAAIPWPTYDDHDWRKIPDTAAGLGLAAQALAYEKENRNRDTVVKGLEERLEEVPQVKREEKADHLAVEPGTITL